MLTMRAYPECFLNPAKNHLAEAFDCAIEAHGLDGELFAWAFASSDVGRDFEKGRPWAVCGMSGIELAHTVMSHKIEPNSLLLEACTDSNSTVAFWVGWSLAVYQWRTARSFSDIFRVVSYGEIAAMYGVYHEQDVSAFVRDLEALWLERQPETNLKRLREQRRLSQSQLAKAASVGLRSIQMYEQRNNDIDKAQAAVLARIAHVLGCTIEDLLEDPFKNRYEYCCVDL